MNPRDVPTVPDAGGSDEEAELPSRLGHFEIVGRLGAGGMGLVFEGKDLLLGRRVALKLLHPNRVGNPIAPARLLREAQALAKLSHRNVVTVYEVGMAGDDPFVAMELVEGKTLAEWMKQRRDWRTVIDVFVGAGHGLAAVHTIGLVHRDFKPSNVLFDKDNTPKLGDFGLVRPVEAPAESTADGEPVSDQSKLTVTGGVMGTPAYMSPEQRLGLPVDARADQYSFAKSLREALGEPIPGKLQPILARALADDPNDRYPSMAPLLEDLSRVRRGNRVRWIGAAAAVAVIGAIAIAWGFGRAQSASEGCARPTDRVVKVWSQQRRSALQTHLLAIDPVLGAQRFDVANGVFDRGAARWMDQYVDACESERAGRQSGALLDRRMACLDRALLEIDDSVAVLESATDRTKLDDAMKATVALPALDDCADINALMEQLPRPTNPVQRVEADAIARETVAIDVARRVGGTKIDVEDRANAALIRARRLGDPVTLARALRSLAMVQLDDETGDPTLVTLREAITVASAAHDDRMVASLWTELLTTLVGLKQQAEAKTLLPAAEAAVARTKATIEVEVDFLNAKAQVAAANGDVDAARAAIDDALKQLDAAGAASPFSPLRPLSILVKARAAALYSETGDFKTTADRMVEVIALANSVYGPDHPSVMQMHWNRGIALRRIGDSESALKELREAARIGEARLSPSPGLAGYIREVGSTLVLMGKNEEAIPYLERASAMARATMPPGDPRLADSIGDLAAVYINQARYDDARPLLDEQIALLEKRGGKGDERLANAYSNRGDAGAWSHHCDNALGDLDNAQKLYRELGMMSDVYVTLITIAECQGDTYQFAAAVRTTEVILAAKDVPGEQRVIASFVHGKVVALAGNHAGGIAEVRAARAQMVRLNLTDSIKGLDRWLDTWAKPGVVWPKSR